MVLVGKSPRTLEKHRRPNLGLLTSPRIRTNLDGWVASGGLWAADNDAFSDSFSDNKYLSMLEKYRGVPNCLWAAVPDVVADAGATLELFDEWAPVVAKYGYPVALVGQDGMTPADVRWLEVDCLFIGGSTEWKLGAEARALVTAAKRHGKLVHMGRVNTRRRIAYAGSIGCDSIDGTATAMFTDVHLPNHLAWAAEAGL